MERSLGERFRICLFSGTEDAIAFARTAPRIDVLVTDLDLGLSALGGCNIARDVQHRFPQALIYVFARAAANDHRLLILRGTENLRLLTKPWGALSLAKEVRRALLEKQTTQ
jgi:hypothetical protein